MGLLLSIGILDKRFGERHVALSMYGRHDRRRDDGSGQNVAETRVPSSIVFTRVVEDPTRLSDGSGGKRAIGRTCRKIAHGRRDGETDSECVGGS